MVFKRSETIKFLDIYCLSDSRQSQRYHDLCHRVDQHETFHIYAPINDCTYTKYHHFNLQRQRIRRRKLYDCAFLFCIHPAHQHRRIDLLCKIHQAENKCHLYKGSCSQYLTVNSCFLFIENQVFHQISPMPAICTIAAWRFYDTLFLYMITC